MGMNYNKQISYNCPMTGKYQILEELQYLNLINCHSYLYCLNQRDISNQIPKLGSKHNH